MPLARKLTLALMVGITLVMAVNGYVRLRRELRIFEEEQTRVEQTIGRTLRIAVRTIWQSEGEGPARRLVERVNGSQEELQVRWVWLDEADADPWQPDLTPAQTEALVEGKELTFVWSDRNGATWRTTYVPLLAKEARPAALQVSESFRREQRYIWASGVQTFLATLVIVMVCGLIATGLGTVFVGRPIGRLVEKARRVGAGDFSGRLDLRQRDEIGALAAEIDAMCDRLVEANRRLEAETETRIAALDQLRHADRLKTVGQLASGIAHELGTPLNVISARAKMIAGGEVTNGEVADNARIIDEQAGRITTTIRQLLDFSRRRGQKLEPSDLRQIAGLSLSMVSTLASKHGVTLVLDDAPESVPVRVDQNQIQQALTNLVLNGIQAMPRGGRLRVAIAHRHASPPPDLAGEAGDYVCVTVEDEGEGIARENVPHIFEPFFTTKGVGEGTGLGLSVTYGIVRDHGGWITVESEVGRGTRFTVYLPPADRVRADRREVAA